MRIEIIPSASRLVRSLRDIGYEFKDAIADIIDNSIEAKSTLIKIELNISTNNSTVIIADNWHWNVFDRWNGCPSPIGICRYGFICYLLALFCHLCL